MLSVLGFLAILGPLVVVHEFGHFLFARLFGVKAEVFSVGFGPTLFSRKIGETEWRLSAVPMGGYVKLLGEEPGVELSAEEAPRALQKQAPWKRFFIFFGGPLFNFLFAILVFMAILVIGEPQLSSRISRVTRESPAELAGFRSGDRIVAVGAEPVTKFEEVAVKVGENPGVQLQFTVERQDAATGSPVRKEIAAIPTAVPGYGIYGELRRVGEIEGLIPTPRSMETGVSDPNSPAGLAGIRTGDSVASLDGEPVGSWEELESGYRALAPSAEFKVGVKTKDAVREIELVRSTAPAAVADLGEDTGLRSSELFLEKVVAKSPAEEAGLKPGDRVISVNGRTVRSFFELREQVQKGGEEAGSVTLVWERDGKRLSRTVKPTETVSKDPALRKISQFTVGIVPMLDWAEPDMVLERVWNPFLLLAKGTEKMLVYSWRNIVSIGKMFTREVSVDSLGGPILIGKLAGDSLNRGLVAFLSMMAMLSVGLGILNILPIPVLDGGHLLLLGIESIRGKPLSLRQMEIVQQVGLSLILLLMVVVMKNDIARLIN